MVSISWLVIKLVKSFIVVIQCLGARIRIYDWFIPILSNIPSPPQPLQHFSPFLHTGDCLHSRNLFSRKTAGICSIRHVSATPSSHSYQHQTVEKSNKTGWVEAAHACYVSFLQTVVLVVLQFWWVSISESCWVFKCLQSDGSLCVLINSIHTVTLSTACKSTSSSEQISDEFPAIKMQVIFGFVMFLSFL